jgi:hypothetical protein
MTLKMCKLVGQFECLDPSFFLFECLHPSILAYCKKISANELAEEDFMWRAGKLHMLQLLCTSTHPASRK